MMVSCKKKWVQLARPKMTHFTFFSQFEQVTTMEDKTCINKKISSAVIHVEQNTYHFLLGKNQNIFAAEATFTRITIQQTRRMFYFWLWSFLPTYLLQYVTH